MSRQQVMTGRLRVNVLFWGFKIIFTNFSVLSTRSMGLDAIKPVFGSLQTTKVQTSLGIYAD